MDFASREEAQSFYEAEGGPAQDPHGLDPDGNGTACDGMPEVSVEVLQAGEEGGQDPNDRDCAEFGSQAEAQQFFESRGGSATNNVFELDEETPGSPNGGNGIACEDHFGTAAGASPTPTGGAAGTPTPAPGATATPSAVPTPTPRSLTKTGEPIETFGITGAVLTLLGLGLVLYARRRRGAGGRVWDEYALIGW
jgi:hypothetical protein